MPDKASLPPPASAAGEDVGLSAPPRDAESLPTLLRRLAHDQLQLATLKLRLAGHSLVAMMVAAVCMAALWLLASVALLAAAGFGLDALGLPATAIMLTLALLAILLALLLRVYIARRSAAFGFPRTLRSLGPAADSARRHPPT